MRHLKIKVSGSVQGVGFRYLAKNRADELGLRGFIRNEKDGGVYIEIEGGEDSLEKFLAWCKQGPEFSRVKKIETKEGRLEGFADFLIV